MVALNHLCVWFSSDNANPWMNWNTEYFVFLKQALKYSALLEQDFHWHCVSAAAKCFVNNCLLRMWVDSGSLCTARWEAASLRSTMQCIRFIGGQDTFYKNIIDRVSCYFALACLQDQFHARQDFPHQNSPFQFHASCSNAILFMCFQHSYWVGLLATI